MLAGFLVVLFVEAPDQLLEHGPHAVVVEARMFDRAIRVLHGIGTEIDVRRKKFLDQRSERVGFREPRDLVAEFEILEDVLDVRGEPVEVGFEVGLELLLAGSRLQIAQRKLRGIVERLAGGLSKSLILMNDLRLVERRLHIEHGLLGRLEDCVEAAQNRHRKDHIAVLAANIQVAEHVVRNAPDEVSDPVQLSLFHLTPCM